MQTEIQNTYHSKRAQEYLRISFDESINIYNQAQLEKRSYDYKMEASQFQKSISFPIFGEVNGQIFCQFYYSSEKQTKQLHNLSIESMNILIGKALTNVYNDFHLKLSLSSPNSTQLMNKNERDISLKYTLFTNNGDIDCLIKIQINQNHTI